ncbi:hypothetical protein KJB30_03695 [Geobacter chapellei]|uniref:Lipoprotein n=2 Tax=Pelotalea chapellei TaxID=44671 RepID=A0ABS5U5D1_9BACT|nr:hypothetical protein [Pelotalea chapellei]
MKNVTLFMLILLVCVSCSMAPERPFTKDQLYKTGIYTYFTVNDSPESVLAAINKEGEVVLDALYRNRPVWLKILGKQEGLTVTIVER